MVAVDLFCVQSVLTSWAVHYGTSTKAGAPKLADTDTPTSRNGLFSHLSRYRFMLVVLLALLAWQIPRPKKTHYNVLGVSFAATTPEIERRYQDRVALEQKRHEHEPSSREALRRSLERLALSRATLVNETRRSSYNRLGDFSETGNIVLDATTVVSLILHAASFQCLSFAVAYLATISPRFWQGRQLFALFSIGVFCLELQLRILSWDLPFGIPYLHNLLIFEQIELVKRLTPTVLGFLMILSAAFFKDETGALLRLLHGVLITNRVLCEHVELLTQQLGEGSVEESHSTNYQEKAETDLQQRSATMLRPSKCAAETLSTHSTEELQATGPKGSTTNETQSELETCSTHTTTILGFRPREILIIVALLIAVWYLRFT